jgi:hypothetical protein
MKLLCIDFDNTLTSTQMLAKVKAIIAANKDRDDIKIGLVVKRSLADDFDPEHLYQIGLPDIEKFLASQNIQLDFIATTHCLYLNPFTPEEITYPIYKDSVDYFKYRKQHAKQIADIKSHLDQAMRLREMITTSDMNRQTQQTFKGRVKQAEDVARRLKVALQKNLQALIEREQQLFTQDVKPFAEPINSLKVGPLYRLSHIYGDPEIMMVENNEQQFRAISAHAPALPGLKWSSLHYATRITENTGILNNLFATLDKFIQTKSTSPQQLPHAVHQNVYSTLLNGEITTSQLRSWAHTSYPIADSKVAILIGRFLAFKKAHGTSREKKLYKDMSPTEFITRLLSKRPLAFTGAKDTALLRSGQLISGGFLTIGTKNERAPLVLADYLSYDEMQIAALLGVSSPTCFINNGSRDNSGQASGQYDSASGTYDDHEAFGVYVGHVGARFEKPDVMEHQFMFITQTQNTAEKGYGDPKHPHYKANPKFALWAEFYGLPFFPSYAEVLADTSSRFFKTAKGFLDTQLFTERMRAVIEPYLTELDKRGEQSDKKVYVHAVGLGTGVWAIDPIEQERIIINVYKNILRRNKYTHISDLDFSYFQDANRKLLVDDSIKRLGINLHFSTRNPADKLPAEHADKLLGADYAWDSNSYPGNEYWQGSLTGSGDPAAACCSLVARLQGPDNISYVCGKELKLYRGKHTHELQAATKAVREAITQPNIIKRRPHRAALLMGLGIIAVLTIILIILAVTLPVIGTPLSGLLLLTLGKMIGGAIVIKNAAALASALIGGLTAVGFSLTTGFVKFINYCRKGKTEPTAYMQAPISLDVMLKPISEPSTPLMFKRTMTQFKKGPWLAGPREWRVSTVKKPKEVVLQHIKPILETIAEPVAEPQIKPDEPAAVELQVLTPSKTPENKSRPSLARSSDTFYSVRESFSDDEEQTPQPKKLSNKTRFLKSLRPMSKPTGKNPASQAIQGKQTSVVKR